ncbi:hypothetical protein F7P69_03755 [Cellulosimicrobium funkei]|nr:hypothetical protein [Cellulosimicrobium funkei]
MAYVVPVFRTMIASPGDTSEIRQWLYERMLNFNFMDSENYGFMLQPILWERHAPAASGKDPQTVLDEVLVSKADILIAIFKDQYGNPVGGHDSGTVHEIETFSDPENGRNPAVIFKKDPTNLDQPVVDQLAAYKNRVWERGYLTADYYSDSHAVDRAMHSVIYQAQTLLPVLEAIKEAEEAVGEDLTEGQEPLPVPSGEAATTMAYSTTATGMVTPSAINAQDISSQWSDGLRFPVSEETREVMSKILATKGHVRVSQLDPEKISELNAAAKRLIASQKFDPPPRKHNPHPANGRKNLKKGLSKPQGTQNKATGDD